MKITKEQIIKEIHEIKNNKSCSEIEISLKAFEAYNSEEIEGDNFCYFEDFEKAYIQLYIRKLEELLEEFDKNGN